MARSGTNPGGPNTERKQKDSMSETTITRQWPPLPPLPDYPYVSGDEDVQAWRDMVAMRELADAILATVTPEAVEPMRARTRAKERTYLLYKRVCTALLTDWPADEAAALLAAWRNARRQLKAVV